MTSAPTAGRLQVVAIIPVGGSVAEEIAVAIDYRAQVVVKSGPMPISPMGAEMRRILIPLIFAALLTVAAVMPAAASGPDETREHNGSGCDSG